MNLWVVSYCDDGDAEATITVFDNWDAAIKCKQFFLDTEHQRVSLDECPLYSNFLYNYKNK